MNIVNQKAEDTSVRHSKIWQYTSLAVMAIILILALLVTYWLLQPSKVLNIKNDPVVVRPHEVSADGGIVILTVDFCKVSDATGNVEASLIGEQHGAKIAINWPQDKTPKGCKKLDIPVAIPAQAQTDVYHVVFEITYPVNPIKTSYVTFRSRSFQVTNYKLQPGDAKPTL